MTDEEPETKGEREARWWRDWWAADYSWDGLAKKEILGGGPFGEETLQSYWRTDLATGLSRVDEDLQNAGELIFFEGRWWHIVHLPIESQEGREFTWKSDPGSALWKGLSQLVEARLARAAFSLFRSGADRRVRLDGAVVFGLPEPSDEGGKAGKLHVCCDGTAFVSDLDCSKVNFGPETTFIEVLMRGKSVFERSVFSAGISFKGAVFFLEANFNYARFSGDVEFDGAVFYEQSRFFECSFGSSASFNGSVLASSSFHGSRFEYNANFERVVFSDDASFSSVEFIGISDFNSSTFLERAHFYNVIFHGMAHFDAAKFQGGAGFTESRFLSDVIFDQSVFSEPGNFDGVTFSNDAVFFGVRFSKYAAFEGATFAGYAGFENVTFVAAAGFNGSTFAKAAVFSGVFEGDAEFRNVVFERQVTFSSQVDKPERGFSGAFYGARFADIADFSRSGPPRAGTIDRNDSARMAIAFTEALFEKTLILTDGSDAVSARAFRSGTMKAIRAVEAGRAREDLLDRLEAGCRTVKIAMGKARDEAREQRYYRFQLQARHARADTHWSEKFFGRLYGAVSDYGASLGRPLACLAGLTVACGAVYWLWASGLRGETAFMPFSAEAWGKVASATSFSFGRSLFLSAWLGVPERDHTTWQWILLNGYGPGWGLLVRAIAALQSILSGVLIFLFALAVRRRFQIGG